MAADQPTPEQCSLDADTVFQTLTGKPSPMLEALRGSIETLRTENDQLRRALAGLVDYIDQDGLAMDDRAMRTALEALGWKR